jgi:hypothetical protein
MLRNARPSGLNDCIEKLRLIYQEVDLSKRFWPCSDDYSGVSLNSAIPGQLAIRTMGQGMSVDCCGDGRNKTTRVLLSKKFPAQYAMMLYAFSAAMLYGPINILRSPSLDVHVIH